MKLKDLREAVDWDAIEAIANDPDSPMDLPADRLARRDVGWLRRNAMVRNMAHPRIEEFKKLLLGKKEFKEPDRIIYK